MILLIKHCSVCGNFSGWYTPEQVLMVDGGVYYGSLYTPDKRGSKGGDGVNNPGGRGGGYIKLKVYGFNATGLIL